MVGSLGDASETEACQVRYLRHLGLSRAGYSLSRLGILPFTLALAEEMSLPY
jgi:hypothetical protein